MIKKSLLFIFIFSLGIVLGISLNKRLVNNSNVEPLPKQSIVEKTSSFYPKTEFYIEDKSFDDAECVWGRWDKESIKNICEAIKTRYSSRTLPCPIKHPLDTNQEKVDIYPVKRDQIKKDFFPSVVDELYREFGENPGGFFANRGEYIMKIIEADVDQDSKDEKIILTAGIGGNHPPHSGYIIKNEQIIFKVILSAGNMSPVLDGNGFLVENQIRDDGSSWCCPEKYRLYRFTHENDQFIAVWEQEVSYILL